MVSDFTVLGIGESRLSVDSLSLSLSLSLSSVSSTTWYCRFLVDQHSPSLIGEDFERLLKPCWIEPSHIKQRLQGKRVHFSAESHWIDLIGHHRHTCTYIYVCICTYILNWSQIAVILLSFRNNSVPFLKGERNSIQEEANTLPARSAI
ncbi:unnamed protein product [Periconia digitata]|uniref:Uncharacterized protein n=1 Tax=Periconia digitata TaxID=1303443 RepID=A0A9W4XJV3_9PLEO|nr:unnamed protein product [Periconia digitata]